MANLEHLAKLKEGAESWNEKDLTLARLNAAFTQRD